MDPIIVIPLFLLLNFIPFIIALRRNLKEKTLVFVINIFAGWTIIAWIGLLLYASMSKNTSTEFEKREKAEKKKQALMDDLRKKIIDLDPDAKDEEYWDNDIIALKKHLEDIKKAKKKIKKK